MAKARSLTPVMLVYYRAGALMAIAHSLTLVMLLFCLIQSALALASYYKVSFSRWSTLASLCVNFGKTPRQIDQLADLIRIN